MKTSRLLPFLFLFASTSLFAEEVVAKVTRLDGSADGIVGGLKVALKDADSLEDNEIVEVKANSVLGFKYTRGEALFVEGPARFRIHAPKGSDAPLSLDLLRGKVNCDSGRGAIAIRTAAGEATVGKGNLAAFDYSPALTSGTLVAYAINGDLPVGSPRFNAVVPSGKMGVFGPGGASEPTAIGPTTYVEVLSHTKGIFNTPTAPGVTLPDLSKLNPPRPVVLSPNGEGAVN